MSPKPIVITNHPILRKPCPKVWRSRKVNKVKIQRKVCYREKKKILLIVKERRKCKLH